MHNDISHHNKKQFANGDVKAENSDDMKDANDDEAGPANEENTSTNGDATTAPVKEQVLMTVLLPNTTKDDALSSPPNLNQQIVWVPKPDSYQSINLIPIKRLNYAQVDPFRLYFLLKLEFCFCFLVYF